LMGPTKIARQIAMLIWSWDPNWHESARRSRLSAVEDCRIVCQQQLLK
jgi:hypothetical protein